MARVPFLDYDIEIGRVIFRTIAIESVNACYRRTNKASSQSPPRRPKSAVPGDQGSGRPAKPGAMGTQWKLGTKCLRHDLRWKSQLNANRGPAVKGAFLQKEVVKPVAWIWQWLPTGHPGEGLPFMWPGPMPRFPPRRPDGSYR